LKERILLLIKIILNLGLFKKMRSN